MNGNICKILLLIIALFILVNCAEQSAGQVEISENDIEREVLDLSKYPQLLAIGKMESASSTDCTVVLVAEDIIVTASHCLNSYSVSNNGKISGIEFHLPSSKTKVVFRNAENYIIGINSIVEIIYAEEEPDFAVLRLKEKISKDVIEPLKIKNLSLNELLKIENRLGCAGFNGDRGLGQNGRVVTISRRIKIIPNWSSKTRIDTNCISTSGGSGGIFFEESSNEKSKEREIYFIGVIWGVLNDESDSKGNFIDKNKMITSITPVSVFYEKLKKAIDESKLSEMKDGKN